MWVLEIRTCFMASTIPIELFLQLKVDFEFEKMYDLFLFKRVSVHVLISSKMSVPFQPLVCIHFITSNLFTNCFLMIKRRIRWFVPLVTLLLINWLGPLCSTRIEIVVRQSKTQVLVFGNFGISWHLTAEGMAVGRWRSSWQYLLVLWLSCRCQETSPLATAPA